MFKKWVHDLRKPSGESAKPQDISTTEETLGLFSFNESDEDILKDDYVADIVAIHGLGGSYKGTWTENDKNWLKDFLPIQLRDEGVECRVLSYGYDSSTAFSKSITDLKDEAFMFLDRLRGERRSDSGRNRPIILVCHSMGGILAKKVMISAHERSTIYGDILNSVKALVFFAVPHRGASLAFWGNMFANLLRGAQLGTGTNTKFLEALKKNSKEFDNISESFIERAATLDIRTFYETELYRGQLVVTRDSAVMKLPKEIAVGVAGANHKTICKFSNVKSQKYRPISTSIIDLVLPLKENGTALRSKLSAMLIKRSLNAEVAQLAATTPETTCLQGLRLADYDSFRARIADRESGTCQWILQHPIFQRWQENEYSVRDSTILWISGDPGCGKSVLAKFLSNHLQNDLRQRGCSSISSHFFFGVHDEQQKDVAIALASIIHQILTLEPDLIQIALRKFLSIGPSFAVEIEALSSLLGDLVSEPRLRGVFLVLDAIDECGEEGALRLLNVLRSLSASSVMRLKIIVTGRPYSYIRRELPSALTLRIKMEESLEYINVDVEKMITARVSRWSLARQISNSQLVKDMQDELRIRADHTFLWVSLVLDILDESDEDSILEIKRLINSTPANLDSIYEKILSRLKHPEKAKKLFSIVVTARITLDVDNINTAWAIRPQENILLNVRNRMFQSPQNSIRDICGLFLRVINGKVYFVHQTARSFLVATVLREGLENQTSTIWKHSIQLSHAHRIMAIICMSLVLIERFYSDNSEMSRAYLWGLNRTDNLMVEYANVCWKDHCDEALWPESDHPRAEPDDEKTIASWLKYLSQPDERLDPHLRSAFLDRSVMNNKEYRLQSWFDPNSDPTI